MSSLQWFMWNYRILRNQHTPIVALIKTFQCIKYVTSKDV